MEESSYAGIFIDREFEVKQAIADAIADARTGGEDLGNRLNSPEAKQTRKASRTVRALMEEQWVILEDLL